LRSPLSCGGYRMHLAVLQASVFAFL
jgi:hypothetical protein